MQHLKSPILIFDSGVGGLSIYQKVRKKLPHLSVVYCCDNAGFPYGVKNDTKVIELTSLHLRDLVRQYRPALVIIACNTASTISLPAVREALAIPVVGVVPAIKTASELSENRCIGLLATPATVNRDYTDQLINDFAADCDVVRVGSSELVYIAEQHVRGDAIDQTILQKIVNPFFLREKSPDTIVLGCTHFPLLKPLLNRVVPTPVTWVDSGEAIARRVESLLTDSEPDTHRRSVQGHFIYTEYASDMKQLHDFLLAEGFTHSYHFGDNPALIN